MSCWRSATCASGRPPSWGVGAYASALLTVKFRVPFPLALIASMAAPALLAYVIGARRPCACRASIWRSPRSALGEVLRILFSTGNIRAARSVSTAFRNALASSGFSAR